MFWFGSNNGHVKIANKILSMFSTDIISRITTYNHNIDAINEKIRDVKMTLHDENIIYFTVRNTSSGTVKYVRL